MEGHQKVPMSVVLVVAFFSLSCTLCPLCGILGLGDDSSVPNHWENEEFSFDYPGD